MSKYSRILRRISSKDPSFSQKKLNSAIRAWEEDQSSSSSSSDQQLQQKKPDRDTILELLSHIPSSRIKEGFFETSYAGTAPDLYLWIIEFLLTQRFNMNMSIFRGHVALSDRKINYTPMCLLSMDYFMKDADSIRCVRMMEGLIDSGGIDLDRKLENGMTALFLAASPLTNKDMRHNRALRCLIRRGANIKETSDRTSWNVLFVQSHGLVLEENKEWFDDYMTRFNLLVQHGADVRHKDMDGNTLLMKNLPTSHDTCQVYVKRLVKLGVGVNDHNNKGETAIMMACLSHNLAAIRSLLDNGADQYIKDQRGLDAVGHVFDLLQRHPTHWGTDQAIVELNELKFFKDVKDRLRLLRQISPHMRNQLQQQALNEDLTCPITGQLMRVPVKTQAGKSYGRQSIQKWLRQNDTDPSTRQRLVNKTLILDVEKLRRLDQMVDSFLERAVAQKQLRQQSSAAQKVQSSPKRSRR